MVFLQASLELNRDKNTALIIACSIIAIELTMNVSYFLGEIGTDLEGIALACITALVPSALLITETFLLSKTRFEIYACESLLSLLDRK